MNPHVRWRLDLARDLEVRLRPFADIRAVAVGGSVARGTADALSDVELLVWWADAPAPAARAAVARAFDAAYRLPDDPGHDHALVVGGLPVDVWHLTVTDTDATLDAVLRERSLDLVAHARLDTVRSAVPLRADDLLTGWRRRLSDYPEALRAGMLARHLPDLHLRHLALAARRDNPTAFLHTLTDVQCTLFLVLLALNRTWFPTWKWLYDAIDRMADTPPDTPARLRAMFDAPPPAAVDQLRELLEETLVLVEAHAPGLDPAVVTTTRRGIDQHPRAHDPPG